MLENNIPENTEKIEITKKSIYLVIEVDDIEPIRFELPSLDEILRIRSLKHTLVDKKLSNVFQEKYQLGFELDYKSLLKKQNRFQESAVLQNRLAQVSELSGHIDLAEVHAEKASELSQDAFYRRALGNYLVRNNNVEKALNIFNDKLLSSDSMSNVSAGLLLLRNGNAKEAFDKIRKALSLDPLNDQARVIQGMLSLFNGEYQSAISDFRIALEGRPTDSNIYHYMAVAYLYLKKEDKAREVARKANIIDPLKKESAFLYADLLSRKMEYSSAQLVLERYVDFNQMSLAALERLALVYFKNEKYDKSIDTFKKLMSFHETSLVLSNIGAAYVKKNDRKKAYQFFNYGLLKMSEEKELNYVLIANLMRSFNYDLKFDETIAIGNRFLREITPDKIAETTDLSDVYFNYLVAQSEKNIEKIDWNFLDSFLESRKIGRDYLSRFLIFASAFSSRVPEQKDRWLKYSNRILNLVNEDKSLPDEDRASLLNNAIFIMLEYGNVSDSEELIEKLQKYVHKKSAPTATFGLYLMKKGNVERGEMLYNEAVKITNSNMFKEKLRVKMYLEMGTYYANLGDFGRAKTYLDRAVKNDSKLHFGEKIKNVLKLVTSRGSR